MQNPIIFRQSGGERSKRVPSSDARAKDPRARHRGPRRAQCRAGGRSDGAGAPENLASLSGQMKEFFDRTVRARRGATLSFYTGIDCHWLSFLRELHTNLAVVAVIFSQNDSVAHG
jgi:hypothetical protein